MLSRAIAKQLKQPSGLAGRFLLPRLWNRHNAALNEAVLEHLDPRPGEQVLEVGFGGGYLLGRLLERVGSAGTVSGVDAALPMVRHGERRHRGAVRDGRLRLRWSPAERLPFGDRSFQRACSCNVLFYVESPAQVLAECQRVLALDGRLVLCLTAPESLARRGFAAHGLTLFEPEQIRTLLEGAGFGGIELHQAADRHRRFFVAVACR